MKSGLSQREVGELLAYNDDGTVGRHELSTTVPSLVAAIAYEIIFETPVSVLFYGVRDAVKAAISKRVLKLEGDLRTRTGKGTRTASKSQKLAWLAERENVEGN